MTFYTNKELERIREGYAAGEPVPEIASELGRTPPSVMSAAKRYGVGRHPNWTAHKRWTQEEDAVIKEMWPEGHTAREIAGKLGRNRNQVIGRANRLGLKHPAASSTSKTVRGYDGLNISSNYPDCPPVTSCQFIEGEPGQGDYSYCSARVRPGHSWCPDHCEVVYTKRDPDKPKVHWVFK